MSPSVEDPNRVVVTADTDDARGYAEAQIGNAIAHQNAAKPQEQEAAQAEKAHQQLLALITPKWPVGTWVETGADGARCGNGQGLTFRADHTLEGPELLGRWAPTGDHLHAVGQDASGTAEIDGTITAGDPVSFTMTPKDGVRHGFCRCSPEEVNAGNQSPPDTFAPAPSTPSGQMSTAEQKKASGAE